MIQTSDVFTALIDTAPEVLHLSLPDGTEVPQTAIQKAYWVGGTNAGDDITLGSTVSLQLQAELKRGELGDLDLTDTRLKATLTIPGADDVIPVAVLQVDKPSSDDDVVTIVAYDAMIYAFSAEYALNDTVQGFDWEVGVDAEALLQAICEVTGVTLATTGLTPVTLTNYTPAGHTYREVIAFLACLWGRFARINGQGELVLGWYAAANRPVLPTRYYQGELKKADYTYTIGYIKCYNETLEETLTAGDTGVAQGIYIKCPWMTQERLQAVFSEIGGFTYRPVDELRFLGDPRLEPGDVLQVTDRDGNTYTVPVMTLRQEYDGGLISQVVAVGKSASASEYDYEGPVTRVIKKAVGDVKSSLIRTEEKITAQVSDVSGKVTELEQTVNSITLSVTDDGDGTSSTFELKAGEAVLASGKIAFDGYVTFKGLSGGTTVINGDCLQTGVIQSHDGETFVLDLDSGTFSMRGSGRFMNEDGSSYIEVDDDSFVLYTQNSSGSYVEKVRIGFVSSGSTDYPYIQLGAGTSSSASAGLVKKFTDGLFIGNGAAKDATGAFSPKSGYAGIFVNTSTGTTYVVEGTNMKSIYTGAAIAKFA